MADNTTDNYSAFDGDDLKVLFGSDYNGSVHIPLLASQDDGPAWSTSVGVSGAAVESSDMTTATAITDAPAAGEKIYLRDLVLSADTAMNVEIRDGSAGTVLLKLYMEANVPVQVTPRGEIISSVDTQLHAQASTAGNIAITSTYNSAP